MLDHHINWPEVPPQPPYEFREHLGRRSDRWRKSAAALYLLSQGFSLGTEIHYLVARHLGLRPTSGSIGRILPRLAADGLIRRAAVPFSIHRRLYLVTPTALGERVFTRLGWARHKTEWERMVRLHEQGKAGEQRHTLAVLYFAYHARLRGHRAGVMPEKPEAGRFAPDVVLRMGTDAPLYVEVERTGHGKSGKWANMLRHQSVIALCARTQAHREQLVDEVYWDFGAAGMATDLETLSRETWGAEGQIAPLWAETWPVH